MLLEKVNRPAGIQCPPIKIMLRNTEGGNEKSLDEIMSSVVKDCGKEKINLGVMKSEPGIGNLVAECKKSFDAHKDTVDLVDIPLFVDELLSVKEQEEIENVYIGSKFACMILEYMNQKFENIIDDDKKATHQTISNEIKELSEKPAFQKKFAEKMKNSKINLSLLEIAANPIIQSGGKYDLAPVCDNNTSYLSSDIIICKTSARYKDYNGFVIRTFMIDADKDQQTKYKILYESFNLLIESLVEGAKLGEVYEKVKKAILEKDSTLENSIPKSFGNGTGLEFNNSLLTIAEGNETVIKGGMVFNVIMSLSGLKKDSFEYSLQIADTLVVKKGSERNVFTASVSKQLSDIFYNMEDDEEEEKPKENNNTNNIAENKRVTRHMNLPNDERTKMMQKRKEHQIELLEKKNEEFRNKMINHAADLNEEVEETKINLSHIKCYDSKSQFPPDMKYGRIYIDHKNFTIFLPLFNQMVPFHISLVKNVSKSEDNAFSVLRINFVIPVSNIDFGEIKGEKPVFIRDVSYKHRDGKLITNILTQIKELIKSNKTKQQENKEKNDLVTQEHLIINKGKRIVLNDVTIRPNLTSKKTTGYLEAHANGLRFLSSKNEKVEIIYKNIKHAFLQPCENELIALVHFHLKNPIIIGKKKTIDIQFYKEVGVQADDLDMRRRGNDYEEYEIELKERQIRDRINDEFARFAKNIEEMQSLEFDVPFREMEFTGVPYRSNVTLLPTKYCLVSLVESPAFVITLNEVDIVYFERVSNNLKNFDMTFIFKDLSKQVHRIGAIPSENLDMLKTWLDENDILFGEGLYNINWQKIIQKIKSNPEGFLEEGGWDFIQDNPDSDSSDSEEDGDSNYEVTSEEEEEEEDEDESYSEESEEESESADEELSEEGLSWDELEKKAMKSDKEHSKKHKDEDDDNKRKKGKKSRK